MTDRKVTVNETDLRWLLGGLPNQADRSAVAQVQRLRAALDALGPEPCGHPSQGPWYYVGAEFRCVLPKGHHAAGPTCSSHENFDPIHCGDAHQPPAEVWAEQETK